MSEGFILDYADKLGWGDISVYQKLSEDFIRKYASRMGWREISAYQRSEEHTSELQSQR